MSNNWCCYWCCVCAIVEHLGALSPRARGVVGDVVVAMAGTWVLVDPRVHSEPAIAMPGVHGSLTPAETRVPLLVTEA